MIIDCRKILFGDALWIASNHCGKEVNIAVGPRNEKAFKFFKDYMVGYEGMRFTYDILAEEKSVRYGEEGFPCGGPDFRTGKFKYLLKKELKSPMKTPYVCFHPESRWSGKGVHPAYKRIKCVGGGVSFGTSKACMNTVNSWNVIETDTLGTDYVVDGSEKCHDDTIAETAAYLLNSNGIIGTLSSMYVFAYILGVRLVLTSYPGMPFASRFNDYNEEGRILALNNPTPENIIDGVEQFLDYGGLEIKKGG